MCTAISHHGAHHLFGRTLDMECSYGERGVITPREFRLDFLHEPSSVRHLAMIGTACIQNNTPLYYDAVNEAGLAAAGLNFPGNAVYQQPQAGMRNVASFELIPWILCQCRTLSSAVGLLRGANITGDSFSSELPTTPLHWIIADKTGSVTVEPISTGLRLYENPFGVLTNNPPFDYHLAHVVNFMQLDSNPPQNRLCPDVELTPYSRGMGAVGLPGDFSSSSRFVRAVFAKNHTVEGGDAVSGFFHMMDMVALPYGCVKTQEGRDTYTVYTSCADANAATYYFTTYGCRRIRAVRLFDAPPDSDRLAAFSMEEREDISHGAPAREPARL